MRPFLAAPGLLSTRLANRNIIVDPKIRTGFVLVRLSGILRANADAERIPCAWMAEKIVRKFNQGR